MSEYPVDSPEQQASLLDSSEQFEMINSPYDRMEYVHLTDNLIHRLEGSEEEPRPDFVVFLDKSARPVSWLTRNLWDTLAREPGTEYEEGKVPERQPFLYLNIDSKHMFEKEDLPGLRSLFTTEVVDTLEGVEDQPTFFDGKRVLVVDEIGVSHATSVKAQAYLEMAFPEATIETFTWMEQGPATNYGGAGEPPTFDKETMQLVGPMPTNGRPLTNNLRWYKDRADLHEITLETKRRSDDGRGVIDRDAATEKELQQLDTPRTRFGKQWLSVTPDERMPESQQVFTEMAQMAEEIKSGVLPYWPCSSREDVEERVKLFDDADVRTFTAFRKWFKDAWWGNYNDAPVAANQRRPFMQEYRKMARLNASVASLAIRYGLYER